MQNAAGLNVWTQLPSNERATVTEAIVRILTEEVENEWLSKDSSDASRTPGGRLHPAVRSQAGSEES
jgi:hypothetical protein